MRVMERMSSLSEDSTYINTVGSSSSFAMPHAHGANHLLGYCMGKIVHMWSQDCNWGAKPGSVGEGTGGFYTYRHPNCDYLGVIIQAESTSTGSKVTITAGSGAATDVLVPHYGFTIFSHQAVIPWGATSGDALVTYETTDTRINSIIFFNLPRQELDGSDTYVEMVDGTYYLAGLSSGKYIIHGTEKASVYGLVTRIDAIKEHWKRQFLSIGHPGFQLSVSDSTWKEPVLSRTNVDATWKHRATRHTTADTTKAYRVYAKTYFTGTPASGDDYDVRLRSTAGGDTLTSSGMVNTTATWDYLGTIDIDCTADDSFVWEMQYNGSSSTVYLEGLSVYQD